MVSAISFLIISDMTNKITNFKNGLLLRGLLAEAHILELVNLLTDKDTKSVVERYVNIEKQFPFIYKYQHNFLEA